MKKGFTMILINKLMNKFLNYLGTALFLYHVASLCAIMTVYHLILDPRLDYMVYYGIFFLTFSIRAELRSSVEIYLKNLPNSKPVTEKTLLKG